MHARNGTWQFLLPQFVVLLVVCAEQQFERKLYANLDQSLINITYLTYTVSAGEGFNLNRDVYIRAATMVRRLRHTSPSIDVRLLLHPWSRLPHWLHAPRSLSLRWSTFFDLEALNTYIPVRDLHAADESYTDTATPPLIDVLYELLPLAKDGGWDFTQKDTYRIIPCPPDVENRYRNTTFTDSSGLAVQVVVDVRNPVLSARRLECVAVQGKADILKPLIREQPNNSFVMLSSFDRMLHNRYGSPDYWNCRRSMRYAPKLTDIAEKIRRNVLGTDRTGVSQLGNDRNASSQLASVSQPYVAIHVRRGDFARHHRGGTLEDVCRQLLALLEAHDSDVVADVDKIFVASDELESVVPFLLECLSKQRSPKLRLISTLDFAALLPETANLLDGELAIIDQIISSHARLFIGTCDSTFTMRIQEDREILRLAANTTYNCFCNKEERTMREDYGQWSRSGPCYVLRPWRMATNDEEFFRVAFDHKPYVFTKGSDTMTGKNKNTRFDDEL